MLKSLEPVKQWHSARNYRQTKCRLTICPFAHRCLGFGTINYYLCFGHYLWHGGSTTITICSTEDAFLASNRKAKQIKSNTKQINRQFWTDASLFMIELPVAGDFMMRSFCHRRISWQRGILGGWRLGWEGLSLGSFEAALLGDSRASPKLSRNSPESPPPPTPLPYPHSISTLPITLNSSPALAIAGMLHFISCNCHLNLLWI